MEPADVKGKEFLGDLLRVIFYLVALWILLPVIFYSLSFKLVFISFDRFLFVI